MLPPLLSGLGTGLSLIVAIGAQNAFVLRQGLLRSRVTMVVAVCVLSDALLICLGVTGIGAVVRQAPVLLDVLRWAGVAFLVGYGLVALRRAATGGQLEPTAGAVQPRTVVLATCLAFTWLNPHVYLDTVLLLGSIANAAGPTGRWEFAAGAVLGSTIWFTALGYGARTLTPLFRRRSAWRVLDAVIAAVMLGLAAVLAVG